MPPVIEIQKYPFLQLLLPFATGITAGRFFPEAPAGAFVAVTAIAGFFACLPVFRTPLRNRFFTGIFLSLLFLLTGLLAVRTALSSGRSFDRKNYPYAIAVAESRPVQKMRTLAVPAVIRAVVDSTGRFFRENERVMLYFAPSDEAYGLTEGRLFVFRNRLNRIRANRNPEEPDYPAYLQTRGIRYSQYLGAGQWKRLNAEHHTLRNRAVKIRYQLMETLRNTDLTPRQYSLLSSLVLGNRDILMPDQKENFRNAGIAHILAISGLHTGIVFLLVYWLFYPLRLLGKPRLHIIFIVPVIWLYAFITGLPVSVVRAAVMITVVLGGRLLNRRSFTANSLAMAAFLMLTCQPLYLFDAGFQLSFLSVASILILIPPIRKLYWPRYRIPGYFYSIPVVTLAVQAGILPVLLYYFHELPLWSVAVNLVVVPLLPCMLAGGFLLLFTGFFHFPDHYLCRVTGYLLDFTDQVTGYVSSLPNGVLRNIAISPEILFFYFLVAGSIYFYIRARRPAYLVLTGLLLAGTIALYIYQYTQNRLPATIIVYNTGGPAAVNLLEGKRNYICTRDSFYTADDMEKAARNFWIKHRVYEPEILRDSATGTELSLQGPRIGFYGRTLLLIDSHPLQPPPEPVYVDYGIIGPGFQGRAADLIQSYTFGEFIITAGVHPQTSLRLQRECRRLHLNCYVVKDSGARVITLPVKGNQKVADKRILN